MNHTQQHKIAVIGGGAAGFFAAITAKESRPNAQVTIYEKSLKLLSKVKVSGGGRCNVTNGCTSISQLCKAYPRGGKQLKKSFVRFNTKHTMAWFESRDVKLVIQDDGCVFPTSQDSQTIIDCFLREANRLGIRIEIKSPVKEISIVDQKLQLSFTKTGLSTILYDKVIVATGGSPKRSGLVWLESLGHKIEDPVPSLFTFNMPKAPVTKLMGVVVEHTTVYIQGTKLKAEGPLLITHWGMSGPAILVLSAFGARYLSEQQYSFKVRVNWANEGNNDLVSDDLVQLFSAYPKKLLANVRPSYIPSRLWLYLLDKIAVSPNRIGEDVGKKIINKLTTVLTNDVYEVHGKTTFKEEFVTCGGVSLESINMKTMESKHCPNLYFAGEVMDIDAITGGYNFQAAWTTGYIAGQLED